LYIVLRDNGGDLSLEGGQGGSRGMSHPTVAVSTSSI